MNFTRIFPLLAMLFVGQSCFAEEVKSPDGFNLTKLYEKYKDNTAKARARKIMTDDFQAALEKNRKPTSLFVYANKGDPNACNLVGYLFDAGKGVKQNEQQAIKWFTYCAKKNPVASYNLGTILASGKTGMKDYVKAEPYLQDAWNQLHKTQAAVRLAYIYKERKDYKSEWDWVRTLELSKAHPKHWGYLTGEMIINHTAPIYDMAKANAALQAAVDEYSVPAATLLAYSYGNGLAGKPDKINACVSDILALAFMGKYETDGRRWILDLDEGERSNCHSKADYWLKTHGRPAKVDFESLSSELID